MLACSVLKASYRTIVEDGCRAHLRLVYLKGTVELFRARLAARKGHFMGPQLLDSQVAILEEPADALGIDAALPPGDIVRQIRCELAV